MSREIKFRVWDRISKKLHPFAVIKSISYKDFEIEHYIMVQFTGFKDTHGRDIYEGDILSDWVETDGGKVQSKQQVFWDEKTGGWHLDHSLRQDKYSSFNLYTELNDFKYVIVGNIYENKLK